MTSPAGDARPRAAFDGIALGMRDVSLVVGKEVAALVQELLKRKQS